MKNTLYLVVGKGFDNNKRVNGSWNVCIYKDLAKATEHARLARNEANRIWKNVRKYINSIVNDGPYNWIDDNKIDNITKQYINGNIIGIEQIEEKLRPYSLVSDKTLGKPFSLNIYDDKMRPFKEYIYYIEKIKCKDVSWIF